MRKINKLTPFCVLQCNFLIVSSDTLHLLYLNLSYALNMRLCENLLFLGNDGFSLAIFGAKASDSMSFHTVSMLRNQSYIQGNHEGLPLGCRKKPFKSTYPFLTFGYYLKSRIEIGVECQLFCEVKRNEKVDT